MPDEALLTLTADIVAAHVSNNNVSTHDVPTLVQSVYGALSSLMPPQRAPAPSKLQPAVSLRTAIKPDAITCLVCGARQKMLRGHLNRAHGMTPADYRAEFDLRADYPMVAPKYSEKRRELAKSLGLGTKGGQRKRAATSGRRAPAANR